MLQDKKTSKPFYKIYHENLSDIPDNILEVAAKKCLKECRFFPTIAEIRERVEPLLQEWNLENRRLLAENEHSKCPENVWWDEHNNPHCKIEEGKSQENCKLAGTGMCGKWKEEFRS